MPVRSSEAVASNNATLNTTTGLLRRRRDGPLDSAHHAISNIHGFHILTSVTSETWLARQREANVPVGKTISFAQHHGRESADCPGAVNWIR
jgi:hypothetical protein